MYKQNSSTYFLCYCSLIMHAVRSSFETIMSIFNPSQPFLLFRLRCQICTLFPAYQSVYSSRVPIQYIYIYITYLYIIYMYIYMYNKRKGFRRGKLMRFTFCATLPPRVRPSHAKLSPTDSPCPGEGGGGWWGLKGWGGRGLRGNRYTNGHSQTHAFAFFKKGVPPGTLARADKKGPRGGGGGGGGGGRVRTLKFH